MTQHSAAGRRTLVRLLLAVVAALVLPAVVGAVAYGTTGAVHARGASSEGLAWMSVRDSSGIPVSNYLFAADRPSGTEQVTHLGDLLLILVLDLEFAGWSAIVITAIWLIGYALSFRWLELFSRPLNGAAESLSEQIATPLLLAVAAAIGAFCVGWFTLRGFHAKAATQVLTMLAVAVLGPMFLAAPLADVLSADGLLAQGRNVGVAIAAGLNGEDNPNPRRLVTSMQSDLADNFARKPLQVWNFGHVIDKRASCRAGWSAAVLTNDSGEVLKAVKNCDSTAYHAAKSPDAGQLGLGLILIVSGALLLAFAAYLSIKIIWAALDSIYHCLMAIFGFAAGGFIYGPTQTFLIRNLVDSLIAAARMATYTIFLGIYVLFLSDLFTQANNHVLAIFLIGAIIEIIAILQLKRLTTNLTGANDWIANRVATALQSPGTAGGGGGGGGGGRALGMGAAGAGGAMSAGMGMIAGLAALQTINMSPATAWLAGKTANPMNPYARDKKKADVMLMTMHKSGMPLEQALQGGYTRKALRHSAERSFQRSGLSIETRAGVADVYDMVGAAGGDQKDFAAVAISMGASNDHVTDAIIAANLQKAHINPNSNDYQPRVKAEAALKATRQGVGSNYEDALRAHAKVVMDNFTSKTKFLETESYDRNFIAQLDSAIARGVPLVGPESGITQTQWDAASGGTLHRAAHTVAENFASAQSRFLTTLSESDLVRAEQASVLARDYDHITDSARHNVWPGQGR